MQYLVNQAATNNDKYMLRPTQWLQYCSDQHSGYSTSSLYTLPYKPKVAAHIQLAQGS